MRGITIFADIAGRVCLLCPEHGTIKLGEFVTVEQIVAAQDAHLMVHEAARPRRAA